MIARPSVMPAVRVLFSEMALRVGTLSSRTDESIVFKAVAKKCVMNIWTQNG